MVPGQDPSSTIPMVSIAAVGGEAPIWTTYERLAVEACLQQLKDHGYFVPDFSYFRIKQLQARESNVILTTERLFAGLLDKTEYEIFFLVIVNFSNVALFFQLS